MSTPRAAHLFVLLLSVLAISAAAPLPVYDTDGHELSAGADYYVLPATRGNSAGGLSLAPHGRPCPLFVAQEDDPLDKGVPVRFTPLQGQSGGGGDGAVRVSSDVGIYSHIGATTCVQSTDWHVAAAPPSGRQLVVTGPVKSLSPTGREKVFRVEKHSGPGYKLVWCGGAGSSCQDLGVLRDDGVRGAWLGTTDRAHAVVFEKATSTHA